LGDPYDYLTHKPRKGSMLERLVVQRSDPGEVAYWQVKQKVRDFLAEQGKDVPSGFDKSDRQLALYYHKKSLQFGDKENAKYWLNRYHKLGGTDEGIEKSLEKSEPLGGLSDDDEMAFLDSLTPKQRLELRRANSWYRRRMYSEEEE